MVAAMEHFGRWSVDARPDASTAMRCEHLVRITRRRPLPPPPAGWLPAAELTRPTEREEVTEVFRRAAAPAAQSLPALPALPALPPAALKPQAASR
jgi:hypothetical protein